MDPVDRFRLARHIADSLDGNYDDGLEAYVAAGANGNGLHVTLFDDQENRLGSFRVIVEQIS